MELFPGKPEAIIAEKIDASLHRHVIPGIVLSDEARITDRGRFDECLGINSCGPPLWDCEERARLLGVASAPANPEILGRVAVLRDDPMETPDVRAAARARLVVP